MSRWRLKAQISTVLAPIGPEDRNHSVRRCGMAKHDVDEVGLTLIDGRAGVEGAHFCKSVWLCPTCAPRMALGRAEEVGRVFAAAEARGGAVTFVTLTIRHRKSDALAILKEIVSGSCTDARQGKPWALAKERYAILGTLVGPEVTHSERHGWHFHLHCAVVLDDIEKTRAAAVVELEVLRPTWGPHRRGAPLWGPQRQALAERIAELEAIIVDPAEAAGYWLLRRYERYVERKGGSTNRRAQDVTVCFRQEDLADYLSKGSLAWEVSNAGATKRGRKGRTPWDLAAISMEKGWRAQRARELFQEYAACMPGTRSCVVTASLAKALRIEPTPPEPKKEPPKPEDQSPDDTVVTTVERGRWHRLVGGGHVAPIFAAIEAGKGKEHIVSMIDARIGPEPTWLRPWMHASKCEPPPPPPPPPTEWRPTLRDIGLVDRSHTGSTARQCGEVKAGLLAEAARRGLPLAECDAMILAAIRRD